MKFDNELVKYIAKHHFIQMELVRIVNVLDDILEDLELARLQIAKETR